MMTKTKADKYPQRVRNELRFRELTVLRVERAGAAFQRIVLGGEALEGFASHGFDDHTKLFFPEPGAAFTPPQVTEEGIDWGEGVRPATGLAFRQRLKHHRHRVGAGVHVAEQAIAVEIGRASGAGFA